MKTDAEKGYTILIGHELDNEASIVRFDVSNLIAEYGSGGTFAIYNRIPSSSSAYPVASTNFQLVDGFIEWTITDDETTAEGNGECQLKYTINGKVIMSTIYKTNIKRSVLQSGTTPTPWTPWVNQLEDIRDEAIEAQEKAEEAVEKYPRIDQTTKHWLVYDAENDEWDDTGIVAEGKNASMYVVTMTRSGATYNVDKTFTEIKNAHETSQVVVLKYDGHYMQLCALSNSAVGFSIYIDSANFAVTISSANVVSVTEYEFYTKSEVDSAISAHHDSTKQDTLVSGTNIKTLNGASLLGMGDMQVQATLNSGVNIKSINNESILGSGNINVLSSIPTASGSIIGGVKIGNAIYDKIILNSDDELTITSQGASNGQVLTADGNGGTSWQSGGGGMTNPMTTDGDIIIGGVNGAAMRLGRGSANQFLRTYTSGSSPQWSSINSDAIDSTGITSGYVLKANGSGGASWGAESGSTLYQHNILLTASSVTTSSSYLSLSLSLITDSAVAFTASTLFSYINAKIHDTSVTTNGISCSGSVYNSSLERHCVAIKVSGYDDTKIRVSHYGVEGSGLTTRTFDTSSVRLFSDNVFQL